MRGTVFQGNASVIAEGKGPVGGLQRRGPTGSNSMSPPRAGARGADSSANINRAEGKIRRKLGDRGAKPSKEVKPYFLILLFSCAVDEVFSGQP